MTGPTQSHQSRCCPLRRLRRRRSLRPTGRGAQEVRTCVALEATEWQHAVRVCCQVCCQQVCCQRRQLQTGETGGNGGDGGDGGDGGNGGNKGDSGNNVYDMQKAGEGCCTVRTRCVDQTARVDQTAGGTGQVDSTFVDVERQKHAPVVYAYLCPSVQLPENSLNSLNSLNNLNNLINLINLNNLKLNAKHNARKLQTEPASFNCARQLLCKANARCRVYMQRRTTVQCSATQRPRGPFVYIRTEKN